MPMIIEGLITTRSPSGTINLAPMGPVTDPDLTHLVLRPFKSSMTYQNLKRHPEGVFHITDNVLLIAHGAIGEFQTLPDCIAAELIQGVQLADCCQSFEFKITSFEDEEERTTLHADVLRRRNVRPFLGFNRAKHAVIEAAIIATRLHLLPAEEILREFDRLEIIVDKTAGDQEFEAFELLADYVKTRLKR